SVGHAAQIGKYGRESFRLYDKDQAVVRSDWKDQRGGGRYTSEATKAKKWCGVNVPARAERTFPLIQLESGEEITDYNNIGARTDDHDSDYDSITMIRLTRLTALRHKDDSFRPIASSAPDPGTTYITHGYGQDCNKASPFNVGYDSLLEMGKLDCKSNIKG